MRIMNSGSFFLCSLLIYFFSLASVFGQVNLFTETFDEPNGSTSGVSAEGINWTASCPSCALSNQNFDVQNGVLECHNTDGVAVWSTDDIDISNCISISLSFDYVGGEFAGSGNMESNDECTFNGGCAGDPDNPNNGGCFNCWDFMEFSLYIDGIEEQLGVIGNGINETNYVFDFGPECIEESSDAFLEVRTQTWANDEFMTFDNVFLICNSEIPEDGLILVEPGTTVCEGTDVVFSTDQSFDSYDWQGPAGSSDDPSWTIPNIDENDTGTYTLNIEDAAGCTASEEVELLIESAPFGEISGGGNLCLGECLDISVSIAGGVGPYTLEMIVGVPPLFFPIILPSIEIVDVFTVCADAPGVIPDYDSNTNTLHLPQFTNITVTLQLQGISDSQGCEGTVDDTQLSLTLLELPSASAAGPLESCDVDGNGTSPFDLSSLENIINGGSGNSVKFYEDIDLTTEIFSPYESGTTTIYATVEDAFCTSEAIQIELILQQSPDVFSLNPVFACNFYILPTIEGLNLSGNEAYYEGPNGTGDMYVSGQLITNSITLYIFDEIGDCSDEESFIIVINSGPDIFDPNDVISCDSFILPPINGTNLSGSEAYYSNPNGSGNIFFPGMILYSSTVLYIYDGQPGCDDEESVVINVFDSPEIEALNDTTLCGVFEFPEINGSDLSGNESYYDAPDGEGTQYNVGEIISSSGVFYIYDQNGTCSDETSFMVSISLGPELSPVLDTSSCIPILLEDIEGTNLSGNEGYYDAPNGMGNQYFPGDIIDQSVLLYIYDGITGCEDEVEFTLDIGSGLSAGTGDSIVVCVGTQLNLFDLLMNEDTSGVFQDLDGSNALTDSLFDGSNLVEGSYSFQYFIQNEMPCPDDSSLIVISVVEEANAGFDTIVELCLSDDFDLNQLTGDSMNVGMYEELDSTGALSGSIITLDSLSPNTYVFQYIVGDGFTCPSDTSEITIVWNPPPVFEITQDTVQVCSFYILPQIQGEYLNGSEAYFLELNGEGDSYYAGDTLFTSETVYVFVDHLECFSEALFYVEIEALPDSGENELASACAGSQIDLQNIIQGNQGGYFADIENTGALSGTIFDSQGFSGSVQFVYIVDGVLCSSDSSIIQIDLVDELEAGTDISSQICPDGELFLTVLLENESPGGVFQDLSNTGALSGDTLQTDNLNAGIYNFQYVVGDNITCPQDSSSITIEILTAPDFLSPDLEGCDSLILPVINGQNLSGNEYYSTSIDGGGTILNVGDVVFSSQTIYMFDPMANCPVSESFDVFISASLSAGEDVNIPLCESDYVNLTFYLEDADIGGQFFDPMNTGMLSGNFFDASGNPGIFEIIYFNGGQQPCTVDSSILTIDVQEMVFAGEDVDIKICEGEALFLDTLLENADLGGAYFDINNSGGLTGNLFESTGLGGQTIEIVYSIGNGGVCLADNAEIHIEITAIPQIDPIDDLVICEDTYELPFISGQNLSGNEGYFTSSDGQGINYQPSDIIDNNIELFVYDGEFECSDEESFLIEFGWVSAQAEVLAGTCEGDSSGMLALDIEGLGTAPYDIFINGELYMTSDETEVFIDNLPGGAVDIEVLSAQSCNAVLQETIPESMLPQINYNSIVTIQEGESIQQFIDSNQDSLQIIWEEADGISCLDCFFPIFNPLSDTEYFFTIIDLEGCELSGSILVRVEKEETLYIPNAFSPNNDGINDYFFIQGASDFTLSQFLVFNRFGELMFERNDGSINVPEEGWNGSFKNRMVNPGVYTYYCRVITDAGEIIEKAGDILVIL